MKNKLLILAILLAVVPLLSCNKGSSGAATGEENLDKNASYALGMNIGMELKEDLDAGNIIPVLDEFIQGFRDSITGGKTRFTLLEAGEILENAFNAFATERNAEAARIENAFLAENSRKPGVNITSTGLQYEVVTEGNGRKPLMTDMVQVHYEGVLLDGTIFDSSYQRGTPVEFPLNAVIRGWTEGLQLMNVGSTYILYIPSELGYGPNGWGPIPPFATLIFTVELLGIL